MAKPNKKLILGLGGRQLEKSIFLNLKPKQKFQFGQNDFSRYQCEDLHYVPSSNEVILTFVNIDFNNMQSQLMRKAHEPTYLILEDE